SSKLLDPRSALDPDEKLELRDAWQFEIDLAPFKDDPAIKPWLDEFRKGLKPNVVTFVFDKTIEGEGLESRPISRDLPWGVPIPEQDLDGESIGDVAGKVLYVWFEAPIGYISSTIEWARREDRDWRRYWIRKPGEEGARLIHFIGKDNITFHCILWPAMLAWQTLERDFEGRQGPGPGEEYVRPENVPANEFLNLEGLKFSTSRNWAIWLPEYLDRYEPDPLRYVLAAGMPETGDSDFSWREYVRRNNDELVATYGNLVHRVLALVAQNFDGRVPEPGSLDSASEGLLDQCRRNLDATGANLEVCHFRAALQSAFGLAQAANRYLDRKAPWQAVKSDRGDAATTLWVSLSVINCLKTTLYPFLPFSSEKLHTMLGFDGELQAGGWSWEPDTVKPGQVLGKPEHLFVKLDESVAEREAQRLGR
ncbi:MAG: class I tRNA ligase family protein, partial [Chloroflexi bacterium]|nr:class I tRNA ligase family protein [Chloroflexota bacterium]